MTEMRIRAGAGHVVWDMERFEFLEKQDNFDSVCKGLPVSPVLLPLP